MALLPKHPFKAAERFIVLRDKLSPTSWTNRVQQISDMILMPLISLFLLFTGSDMFMVVSSFLTAYRVWTEYIEYENLRYSMQLMRLRMYQGGGPVIVTNDPKYMPYVWADAVVRYEDHPRLYPAASGV
jgi:hypothetical protein